MNPNTSMSYFVLSSIAPEVDGLVTALVEEELIERPHRVEEAGKAQVVAERCEAYAPPAPCERTRTQLASSAIHAIRALAVSHPLSASSKHLYGEIVCIFAGQDPKPGRTALADRLGVGNQRVGDHGGVEHVTGGVDDHGGRGRSPHCGRRRSAPALAR